MNKKEFVDKLAEKLGLTKTKTEDTLDILLETIQDVVLTDELKFVGFGNFKTVQRAPRTARNPKTGESIEVPAKTVVSFKPGKYFKELVGNK